MSSGWIKLHRQLLDSRVFANEGLLKVWIYCLLRANHKSNWVNISTGRGSTEVYVPEGSFIYGRHAAADELSMAPSTVHSRMQKLQEIGNINIQPDTHCSLVSLCNWETYQDSKVGDQQAYQHPSDNQPTTNRQPSNTNKNVNNVKNDNNVHKRFGKFWESYPKKQGKAEALDEWATLSEEQREDAIRILPAFLTHFSSKKYTPKPATYLSNRAFEDQDYRQPLGSQSESAQVYKVDDPNEIKSLKEMQRRFPTQTESR